MILYDDLLFIRCLYKGEEIWNCGYLDKTITTIITETHIGRFLCLLMMIYKLFFCNVIVQATFKILLHNVLIQYTLLYVIHLAICYTSLLFKIGSLHCNSNRWLDYSSAVFTLLFLSFLLLCSKFLKFAISKAIDDVTYFFTIRNINVLRTIR